MLMQKHILEIWTHHLKLIQEIAKADSETAQYVNKAWSKC